MARKPSCSSSFSGTTSVSISITPQNILASVQTLQNGCVPGGGAGPGGDRPSIGESFTATAAGKTVQVEVSSLSYSASPSGLYLNIEGEPLLKKLMQLQLYINILGAGGLDIPNLLMQQAIYGQVIGLNASHLWMQAIKNAKTAADLLSNIFELTLGNALSEAGKKAKISDWYDVSELKDIRLTDTFKGWVMLNIANQRQINTIEDFINIAAELVGAVPIMQVSSSGKPHYKFVNTFKILNRVVDFYRKNNTGKIEPGNLGGGSATQRSVSWAGADQIFGFIVFQNSRAGYPRIFYSGLDENGQKVIHGIFDPRQVRKYVVAALKRGAMPIRRVISFDELAAVSHILSSINPAFEQLVSQFDDPNFLLRAAQALFASEFYRIALKGTGSATTPGGDAAGIGDFTQTGNLLQIITVETYSCSCSGSQSKTITTSAQLMSIIPAPVWAGYEGGGML